MYKSHLLCFPWWAIEQLFKQTSTTEQLDGPSVVDTGGGGVTNTNVGHCFFSFHSSLFYFSEQPTIGCECREQQRR